jgi:hypothetical protein
MKYKGLGVLVILPALFVAATTFAQSQNDELDAARAALQAGRDQIIREDLQLSEDELSGFWPVYQQYVTDLAVVRERKAVLVGRFLEAYRSGEFTEEFAEWLIAENFAIKDAWTDVQESFVERFKAVLSVQQVARFYQLENKMEAEVDAQLAIVVPLAE